MKDFKSMSTVAFSFVLILGFIMGCAKKDDSDDVTTTDLEGIWISGCMTGTDNVIDKFTFSGSSFTQVMTIYADNKCKWENFIANMSGTFVIGADVTSVAGAKKFDATYTAFKGTPQTATTAVEFNSMELCGKTDWAERVEKDVYGLECEGMPTKAPNNVLYDIFKLATDKKTMQFGKEVENTYDKSTETKRSIELSGEDYTKQ